jgi:hypothetical protein
VVVCAYLIGRFFVDLALFYGVAPSIARGKAVQLVQGEVVLPAVQESSLSVADELWPGEVLRVRPHFLQFSEEGLKRRLCLVLNWRRAFSCLASGLTGLVELRNERNAGERRVTFASSKDPFAELSIVSVPEGGSFILRAGFLVGVITTDGKSVVIRRHLRLFHWQSWVSGRFGYWEFFGPCRLIVSCVSAVSVEVMRADETGNQPSRWVAQAGVVGFSPQLALKPVRCVSFWRYYTERRPLYEVEISGTGVFLASESGGQARQRMEEEEPRSDGRYPSPHQVAAAHMGEFVPQDQIAELVDGVRDHWIADVRPALLRRDRRVEPRRQAVVLSPVDVPLQRIEAPIPRRQGCVVGFRVVRHRPQSSEAVHSWRSRGTFPSEPTTA